ncbi:winged helix-turn-helix domain-containing protein [Burkholderia contaminans]|uniref:winged helix-turn-helix domain-containing protein n=1 Tax=Burkholderia contaminans TaxID=488447 RepID=UPI00069AB429|nr:winged helix-turn-helix domain-containing protein [Burkholderia contaminans]MEB4642582.1 winged helix-turn-helix domain-containing protein [Burkholderia contaminans]MEB4657587.1 winged helix-turn-helix domain-containing protein [Burkholderia contaminans]MEB4658935.1 winged helix-turn-helix domain-containing protein [Burkholderia contaminans]MEB4672919.1 winged helix-turn-helix domain-containing protein [Burkholderia contaminans]MEB4685170.1 winged helix-turn-helix domain-containing protein 
MHTFDRVAVSLESREIFVNGDVHHISMRAFDILELLIKADGRLVTKDEIMDKVWPNTFVVENNIQVHISALRKIFGGGKHGIIKTCAGRGYRLARPAEAPSGGGLIDRPSRIAVVPSVLVGRDSVIAGVLDSITSENIVTLCGPGGIGKTTIAHECARQFSAGSGMAVCLVDLSDGHPYESVLHATGRALKVTPTDLDHLLATLDARPTLLFFDGCEHVADEVAELCTTLHAHLPDTRILVTSREPLRIAHERVYRIPPLDSPAAGASGDDVLACSSVQMFLKRATATGSDISLDPCTLQLVASMCRALDGIPLALELAASCVASLGIPTLSAELDTRLLELPNLLRAAPPRHKTMGAALDWSYRLLDDDERTLLGRLSVIDGPFELATAHAVASCERFGSARMLSGIVGLVEKSLILTSPTAKSQRYRLPGPTRAYALKRRMEAGERGELEHHRPYREPATYAPASASVSQATY